MDARLKTSGMTEKMTGRITMGLKEYESKRKFGKTPEPKAGYHPNGKGLIFVIHKHAARSLHYDLRLELEGVLKS